MKNQIKHLNIKILLIWSQINYELKFKNLNYLTKFPYKFNFIMSRLFSCLGACHKQKKTIPKSNTNLPISSQHNVE